MLFYVTFIQRFVFPEINNIPIKLKLNELCKFNNQIRAMTLLHNPLTSISKWSKNNSIFIKSVKNVLTFEKMRHNMRKGGLV